MRGGGVKLTETGHLLKVLWAMRCHAGGDVKLTELGTLFSGP